MEFKKKNERELLLENAAKSATNWSMKKKNSFLYFPFLFLISVHCHYSGLEKSRQTSWSIHYHCSMMNYELIFFHFFLNWNIKNNLSVSFSLSRFKSEFIPTNISLSPQGCLSLPIVANGPKSLLYIVKLCILFPPNQTLTLSHYLYLIIVFIWCFPTAAPIKHALFLPPSLPLPHKNIL